MAITPKGQRIEQYADAVRSMRARQLMYRSPGIWTGRARPESAERVRLSARFTIARGASDSYRKT